jgi:hypothetical protein
VPKFSTFTGNKGERRETTGGREREEYEDPVLIAHETLRDITGTEKAVPFYGECKDFSIITECPV